MEPGEGRRGKGDCFYMYVFFGHENGVASGAYARSATDSEGRFGLAREIYVEDW